MGVKNVLVIMDKLISLKEAKINEWYEVVGFNGLIPPGMCIHYDNFNEVTKKHLIVGETIYDEIGYYIHDEDAKKIKLKHLRF